MLAQTLLEAGDLETLTIVADGYRSQGHGFGVGLGQALSDDPVRAHAFVLIERRLRPPQIVVRYGSRPPTDERLDAEGLARAQALADELRARWFPGVPDAPRPAKLGPPAIRPPGAYAAHCDRDD